MRRTLWEQTSKLGSSLLWCMTGKEEGEENFVGTNFKAWEFLAVVYDREGRG